MAHITFLITIQIVVPPLPGKAFKRQLPFRGDDGMCVSMFLYAFTHL